MNPILQSSPTVRLSKVMLLFIFATLLICAPKDVLSQTPTFQTGHDLSSENASEKETLVGQHLWFVPNLKKSLRYGFAKSTMHKDLVLKERLYPTGTITFQVVEKIPRSASTKFQEFYRVRFDDGSNAFIEAITIDLNISQYTSRLITKQNVYLARDHLIDTHNMGAYFSEKFFKEDPMKIKYKIAEIDRAIERAEAERQARGGVRVGMTKTQVIASSWGKPIKVNTTVSRGVITERWVYSGENYLYFINDQLSAIQTSK